MTAFPEWLDQLGLSHCREALQTNGIDFDNVSHLTREDLQRLGLTLGDSLRLLQASALRDQRADVQRAAMRAGASSEDTGAFEGEHRQLTVMFCDLVGYTGLSQRLGHQKKLEKLADLRRIYLSTCAKAVTKYRGEVKQVEGDGLMAYFGLPAVGNDAERGVRAALDIVQAIKDLRTDEPLAVRIGVATGPVLVGAPSGTGSVGADLAVGETPNLAKRFQSVAGVNEVVIAHATRCLVGETFDLTDLGERSLHGITGTCRAWRVERVRQDDGRFRAAHRGTPLTMFVGQKRKEDLDRLLHEWQHARDRGGRAVMIRGDAGIGKSRLTEELLERIQGETATVLRYQCSPFHVNAAWYPIIGQLEQAAGFAREDTPDQKLDKLEQILSGGDAEAAPLLAGLLSLPTKRYSPIGLSPQRQKERTLDVLLGEVEALSRAKPVLVVLEDVHWIDPTTEELVDALVPRLPELNVMLVVTYRSDWQQPYTPHWIDAAHASALSLEPLPREEVAELASHVANGKALPVELVEQLVERADGVPLFIEELTKLHLESGVLLEEGDRYTLLEPLESPTIPSRLNEFLIERLDRYKSAKELAQIGSCIGRVFSYELLSAVSGRKGRDLDRELEQLTQTELVFRKGTPPDATYIFKHALVRDAAYDSLLASQQQKLHARIADVLEKHFQQSILSTPELLAYHRTEAGQLLAAVPLWREAGEAAFARMALQEAVAYLEKGLEVVDRLESSDERDNLELSLREPLHAARLRWRGWAAPEVGVNAVAMLWLAQKQRRPQSLLIGLWGMWINTITQGRVAETTDWARRLVEEGQATGNLDLQIFGHRARLSSHFYLGELPQTLEQRDAILALYDPQHAERWMQLVGNDTKTAVGIFASQALWMLGYPDQARELSDAKDDDSRRQGNPFDIGWALTWPYVFDYLCEPDKLLAHASEADSLAREQSIPLLYEVLVPIIKGLALLRQGQLPEAIASLTGGITGWERRGGHLNLPYLKAALAEAHARGGDLEGALRLLHECLAQIERPGWLERVWLPETLRLKGWVLMRQGKLPEAEAQFRASIDRAHRQGAKSWKLRSATTLAQLLMETSRRDAAYKVLHPVYESFTEGFATHDLRVARALLDEFH